MSNQGSIRSLHKLFTVRSRGAINTLFSKISPIGNPEVSIVPVLDLWVRNGRSVVYSHLRFIIKQLRFRRRFKHALEVSYWMGEKNLPSFSCHDIATRMNLILRVHGVEQVELYFDSIPAPYRTHEIYIALLNCHVYVKNVEKAEAVMAELRSRGGPAPPLSYNLLLTMYYRLSRWDRLDALLQEMKLSAVPFDKYTFGTRLSAYAATSDADGIGRAVSEMEADPAVSPDTNTYAVAADCYIKVGMKDLALEMLNKAVSRMHLMENKDLIYATLLKLYGDTGDRDELYRIWNLYKRCRRDKVHNKVYRSMIRSLVRIDDVAGAEVVFAEWGTVCVMYDVRIPNVLLGVYARRGYLGKAERIVKEIVAGGGRTNVDTWCMLSGLYIAFDHLPEAVGALREAVTVCCWDDVEAVYACLSGLRMKEDGEKSAEEIADLLKNRGFGEKVE